LPIQQVLILKFSFEFKNFLCLVDSFFLRIKFKKRWKWFTILDLKHLFLRLKALYFISFLVKGEKISF
jgi:hypothetical protein